MTRALILSGGGFVGISWQSGVATGLLARGVDLRQADLILGTSGGSVVGSQLALGRSPSEVEAFDFTARPPGSDLPAGPDQEAFQRFRELRGSAPAMNAEVARRIGEVAIGARVMPAEYFLGHFERGLGTRDW